MRSVGGFFGLAVIAGINYQLLVPRTALAETPPGPAGTEAVASLSPDLPYDVDTAKVEKLIGNPDPSVSQIQAAHRLFDNLAWQAFVALNWPANDNGKPDRSKNMSDNQTWRVWNFWRSADSIFLADGEKPLPWDNTLQRTRRYKNKSDPVDHPVGHTRQRDNFEAFTGPLVDQNGNWARFEIRINKEEFDYIVENELYNQDGQVAFTHRPKDNQLMLPVNQGNRRHGSIEVKLAWKEMGPNDDPTRFYTTDLTVDLSEPEGVKPNPKTIRVGLVGMHIAMRTAYAPEWIWSTFEQIDNVRSNPLPGGGQSHPNFVNPQYTGDFNVLPKYNAVMGPNGYPVPATTGATTWIESATTTPVQVKRIDVPTQGQLNPIDKDLAQVTQQVNKEFQALLASQASVFQYYELIDAQWPLRPNAPAFAGGQGSAPESIRYKTPGEMIPVFLVNTTMETYFQKGDQPAGALEQDDRLASGNDAVDSTRVFGTESCVGCHYSAGLTIGFKKDANGNEQLVNGKPVAIYGENSHFGNTGNASFSWMLQQEPQAKPRQPKVTQK